MIELTRRRVLGSLAAAAAVSATGIVDGQSASDWPRRRYDAANTSHSPTATGPRESPQIRSLAEIDGELSESLLVAGEGVYAQEDMGTVSVRRQDGEQRWSRFTADPAGGGLPVAVAHGHVYVTASSVTAALDVASGDRQWRTSGQGFPVTSVADDAVYVAIGQQLTALETDGTERWRHRLGSRAVASATDGETVYLVTTSGVVAVDAAEPTTRWSRALDAEGPPVVADGRVYLTVQIDGTSSLVALSADDGQRAWRAEGLPTPITTTPAVTTSRVFVGAGEDPLGDTLFALEAADGTVAWTSPLGDPATASSSPAAARPAVSAATVFVSSADGTVNAIDAESGDILWRTQVASAVGPPVLAHGALYVTAETSEILVVEEESDTGESDDPGVQPDDESGEQSEPDDSGTGEDDDGNPDDGSDESSGDSDGDGGSDDGSGPGLGVPAALTALGGAGYLLRRRDDTAGSQTDS